ncbi:MAG: M56 family peptidase, partial [Bacilli bacterium]
MNPSVRSTLSLFLVMMIGCLILLQMSMFIVHHIWNVQWTWDLFQYCLTAIDEASVGHIVVKHLFYPLIVYTIVRMTWRLLKQIYLSWKWDRHFQSKINVKMTK